MGAETPAPTELAPALRVNLHFTRYDEGSATARWWMAGLGQIHIDADLEVSDPATHERLAAYAIDKTFAWGGFYGGGTTIQDVEEGFCARVQELLLDDVGLSQPRLLVAMP